MSAPLRETPQSREIYHAVSEYYANKLCQHGPTPRGVDWNSDFAQKTRFRQLIKVLTQPGKTGIIDYGCGYGALARWMRSEGYQVNYVGYDVAPKMVNMARELNSFRGQCQYTDNYKSLRKSDYVIASGIFNVRQGFPKGKWRRYIYSELTRMKSLARLGLSFNMLTAYSDKELMRGDLYYGNPCEVFDFCMRKLSRQVALLHDYGLYEFTILARFA